MAAPLEVILPRSLFGPKLRLNITYTLQVFQKEWSLQEEKAGSRFVSCGVCIMLSLLQAYLQMCAVVLPEIYTDFTNTFSLW